MNENIKTLPTLKPINKGVSIKTTTTSKIKPLSIKDLNRTGAVTEAFEAETIAQEMNRKKGLDLVLVGDLTGSMSSYHKVLKDKFRELCSELFPLIKNLRIGIIFYLDHGCGDPYVTKTKSLTTNIQELHSFISTTETGYGGDEDEALEDALNDLQQIGWNDINARSVVLFGDAQPHEANLCPML